MKFSQITETGLIRENNEDSLLVCPDLGLFAVADGMGGHSAGEVASKETVEYLEKNIRSLMKENIDPENIILKAMQNTNRFVYDISKLKLNWRGMGTTVTACFIPVFFPGEDNNIFIAHVGDSRAYLMKNRRIIQVTSDHSLVGEMLKNGSITEETAHDHPKRNILTKAIGISKHISIDLHNISVSSGNKILLCTDGLTNHVKNFEINEIVLKFQDVEGAAKKLVDTALSRGGTDNISVILIEV